MNLQEGCKLQTPLSARISFGYTLPGYLPAREVAGVRMSTLPSAMGLGTRRPRNHQLVDPLEVIEIGKLYRHAPALSAHVHLDTRIEISREHLLELQYSRRWEVWLLPYFASWKCLPPFGPGSD